MSLAGISAEDYDTPLFVAWQLTNRCDARCLACCEDSGPDLGWSDELSREEALRVARDIVAADVPYVAFGGGEPLSVPHCWELFDVLTDGGVALKLETNGMHIDDCNAERLARLAVDCVQISVDGATAGTHEKVRPGSSFAAAVAAIGRLVEVGLPPQSVFVPNRHNAHEALTAFDQAVAQGCEAFVTGPLMRLGRAAAQWQELALSPPDWAGVAAALQARAALQGATIRLCIYPWDIVTELERRLDSPQAMILVVPNGRVKLLNALPFAVADLRRDSLGDAWRRYLDAWHAPEVRVFIDACRDQPGLLAHANAVWPLAV